MLSLSGDENSDSNVEFNINNEYAKNYNHWRQKEELNKCKYKKTNFESNCGIFSLMGNI